LNRRSFLWILASLFLLSACSGSGTSTPTPWMAAANLPGEIIYIDGLQDGLYLCLILPDRSDLRCQALGEQMAVNFTWAADGSRVAYLLQPVSEDLTEVWVVEPSDITSARKVLDSTLRYPTAPALSADGRWLVVESQPLGGGMSDLLLVDLAATNTVQPLIAANSAYNEGAPDISPAAAQMAFVSDRVEEATTTLKIYSASLEGANLQRLTPAVGADCFAPSWSPDGAHIAFLRRGKTADPADGMWLMDADGGNMRQVASISYLTLDSDPPSWSPDGKWLAYLQGEEDGGEELVFPQAWVVAAGGGQPVQLSQSGVSNFIVSWSPDSRALLYTQRDGQEYFLYMVRPDGSDRQKFIACDLCAFGAWSPK
jgi:Tol biopolymer transport system component